MKLLASVPAEKVESKIFLVRGKKIMLDRDLANLYGVETKALNQAVRRNKKRFPADFMFQLNKQESIIWSEENLKSQIVTSSLRSQIVTLKHGGVRKPSFAFTEQGIAMLSSVLKSDRAIAVNIEIMRTFTRLRELVATNKELRERIEKLEKKYDGKFAVLFDAMDRLLSVKETPRNKIGFWA